MSAVIDVNAGRFVQVSHDQVLISVIVEIAVSRRITHALFEEAPFFARVLKFEIAHVPEDKVFLQAFGRVLPKRPLRLTDLLGF